MVPKMTFRKDFHQIGKSQALFGKNIIVTDNHDWTTEQIVQNSFPSRKAACGRTTDSTACCFLLG